MSIALVTDSNSGIKPSVAKELGIYVVPMPFTIDEENYFEDINLTQEEFYKKLNNDSKIFTSQPAVGDVLTLWDDLLTRYDEIVYIPMSSGLSKSYETAEMLSQYDEYKNKVFVINNQRISLTQNASVLDALMLIKEGKSGLEIKTILEKNKFESSIYITLDTLKYLCRGGRVTKSAAMFAKFLGVKPVLTIQGEKLDAYDKARGKKKAYLMMIDAIKNDIEKRFDGKYEDIHIGVAYSNNIEEAEELIKLVKEKIPNCLDYVVAPLSLSVACHVGPNSMGMAISKRI